MMFAAVVLVGPTVRVFVEGKPGFSWEAVPVDCFVEDDDRGGKLGTVEPLIGGVVTFVALIGSAQEEVRVVVVGVVEKGRRR